MSPFGPAIPDLGVRTRRAELMDDPELERGRHLEALQALAVLNRVSLVGARLWREIDEIRARTSGPVRVLDLACGGGDVLLDVAARARRAGADVDLHGCDLSPVAVARAREAAGDAVHFHELDVLRCPLPDDVDLMTTSLFLHHLDRAEAIDLLRRMGQAARQRVFVQDLRRTRLGWLLAWVGARTLTRSDVVRVDGPRSVEAAFTTAEARSLSAEAGLQGARVVRSWPQRFTIRWTRAGFA